MEQPGVARALEDLRRQPGGTVSLEQLASAEPGVPGRLKAGQRGMDLLEADAVIPWVGVLAHVFDGGLRQQFVDDAGQVADLVVLPRGSDVEGLVVDRR